MNSSKLYIHKRSRFPKGLWAALAVLVLAGGGAAWYFLLGPGQTAQAAQGATPQSYTTTVRRGDLVISASGSGTLAAGRSADLSFPTGGLVAELNVQVGDLVKPGDLLARLGNTEGLDAAVAAAQVDLLTAQQALNDLQSGASLSLAQAYQDLVTAQAAYDTAQTSNQRMAYARCSQDVLTRDQSILDNAKSKLDHIAQYEEGPNHSDGWINANNEYQTALANYNDCLSYTSTEKISAQSGLDIAQVSLQQAQQKYDTLKAGSGIDPNQLALDEAAVTAAQARLADAEAARAGAQIVAPFAGKVTYLASGVGTIAGTAAFITISDVSQPVVNVSIDETNLDKLVPGATAEVVFDALPDQTFTGKVTQVDPQLTSSGQYNVATGQIALDMDPAQSLEKLPLGLNASVTIIDQQAKNALLVPETALIDLGGGQYGIMLVGGDGQMQMQVVQVGLQDGTDAEILSGLTQGQQVSTGTVASAASANSASGANNPNLDFGQFGGGGGGFPAPPGP